MANTPIKGMFVPSTGNKKPKGSRNVNPIISKFTSMTAIPPECWPLADSLDSNMCMWTKTATPASSAPSNENSTLLNSFNPSPQLDNTNLANTDVRTNNVIGKPAAASAPTKTACINTAEESTDQAAVESSAAALPDLGQLPELNTTVIQPSSPASLLDEQVKQIEADLAEMERDYEIANLHTDKTEVESFDFRRLSNKVNIDALPPTPALSESEMYLDATFINAGTGTKRAASALPANNAKKVQTMQNLAKVYQERVTQTKAKLQGKAGLANPLPSLEGNHETIMVREMVTHNPTPIATTWYEAAPLVTLRELMLEGMQDLQIPNKTASEIDNLDRTFRSEYIEFVLMVKKLDTQGKDIDDIEWELPEGEFFEEILNEAFADFIESDITLMDIVKWSSVGSQTGVGVFSALSTKLDLIKIFRDVIRHKVYSGHMAESFPRQTMLDNYGLTLQRTKAQKPIGRSC